MLARKDVWLLQELEITASGLPVSASEAGLKDQIEALSCSNRRLSWQVLRLKQAVTLARYAAGHDGLTGLANRSLLLDRLEQAFLRSARSRKQVVLLLVDIDNFKSINDHFGHAAGDDLLREVAGRLSDCVRRADTISRLGGDEFVIVLPDMEAATALNVAERISEKVRDALSAPYCIEGTVLQLTASIGVAAGCGPKVSCKDLLRQADAAMYRAKCVSRHA